MNMKSHLFPILEKLICTLIWVLRTIGERNKPFPDSQEKA